MSADAERAPERMSRAEQTDLERLIRARQKLAMHEIEGRAAATLAEVERQLSAEFSISDEAWQDLTSVADAVVRRADGEIARRCEALGIPREFRPELHLAWYTRGQNACEKRRAELRKRAEAEVGAQLAHAKSEVTRRGLAAQTKLLGGCLSSEMARKFLADLPAVAAELVPGAAPVTTRQLGAGGCAVCGGDLPPMRSDGRYCTPACRSRAFRDRERERLIRSGGTAEPLALRAGSPEAGRE